MALARQCDRCCRYYDEYEYTKIIREDIDGNKKEKHYRINGLYTIEIHSNRNYTGYTMMDLCPQCMYDFVTWFEKPHIMKIDLNEFEEDDDDE